MLAGTKLQYTRRHNRRVILEAIRRNGSISRAEIARMTGLTTAAITNFASELIGEGLILEKGRRKGLRGQPAIELEINPAGGFAIGFELGRTHLGGVLINLTGDILAEIYHVWNYPPPDVALPLIAEQTHVLLKQAAIPHDRFLGVGVAMPGPFLTNQKQVVMPVNFPHWEQFPAEEKLTELLHVNVVIENDAMAAAIGEQFHGSGRLYKNFFYLFLGIGLGSAMILNGYPYRGPSPNTGEVGWMRYGAKGRRSLIGQSLGLQPLYNYLKGNGIEATCPADIDALFQAQNQYLWEWFNEAVDCLDIVVNAINAILGLEAIFLGGHFPPAVIDHLIQRLEIEAAAERVSYPDRFLIYQAKLLRATAGDLSSAVGAATLPLYETFTTEHALIQQADA